MDRMMKWLLALVWLLILVLPCWYFSMKYLKKLSADHNVKLQNTVLVLLFAALCVSAAWIVGLFVL